jgi:phage/plasmid-like protein (TIGR03299 family)
MSHNINFNNVTGKHSFFSVKEKPWHNLGQTISDYPTSAEAIKYAGLDYAVIKSPLLCQSAAMGIDANGEIVGQISISVPNNFATVRTDTNTILGVVGKDYQIVQNKDAFNFFDDLVQDRKDIHYETAGALGNGERIFITAKLPDYIKVGKDDFIEKYLFLTTTHDGSGSITAAFTPVRVVCQNTLNSAMRKLSNVVRIKHTSNVKQRLEQAHKIIGISNELSEQLEGTFNSWAKVRITDGEVKRLIEMALAPNKETIDKIQKGNYDEVSTQYKNQCSDAFMYAMMSDTQQLETTKGTLFGAYNSITGYFQNVHNYSDSEQKTKSIIYGGTASSKTQTAFNICDSFHTNGEQILKLN